MKLRAWALVVGVAVVACGVATSQAGAFIRVTGVRHDPGTNVKVKAKCPKGTRVVTGWINPNGSPKRINLDSFGPVEGNTAWGGFIYGQSSAITKFTTHALCAQGKQAAKLSYVKATAPVVHHFATADAQCPANSKVISGGVFTGAAYMTGSGVSDASGGGWTGSSFAQGPFHSMSIEVVAVCAHGKLAKELSYVQKASDPSKTSLSIACKGHRQALSGGVISSSTDPNGPPGIAETHPADGPDANHTAGDAWQTYVSDGGPGTVSAVCMR